MSKNGPVTASTAPTRGSGRAAKPDQVLTDAVEVALQGLDVVDPDHIGAHLGVVAEGERLVTHFFECGLPGYRGWRWAVTVTRIPRSKQVTICESTLLPGPEALRAPEWVPWQERLQPGDLGVGDLLPTPPDDPRLQPGYVQSDDPADDEVNREIGLGRARVMSRDGRLETAQRWYDGDRGPNAPISVGAPAAARCGSCGFYLQLAGSLRLAFGVCGNEYAPDDAQVVSADHGCGAHSEVLVEQVQAVDELPTVFDDSEVEEVAVGHAPGSVDGDEPAEPYGHG
ncbi:DUF3027 domain-containing protein [Dactylosporangium sp. CS-033363]|uniref:DUF3027 domain-containing protein n=1 Tax=Dactylosporangium sp. CS-033363 TaxID=3239935 RepID=UPI003D8EE08B